MIRIGHGFDVHQLVADRELILGGVKIPHETGLLGHSDADVLLHAISDALLGALAAGDIGKHFPDSDPAYKGADSRELLRRVVAMVHKQGFRLANLDATILCQQPRLASHIEQMCHHIAKDCKAERNQVNIKATTTEKLGFEGRQEGISAHAVVLLKQI